MITLCILYNINGFETEFIQYWLHYAYFVTVTRHSGFLAFAYNNSCRLCGARQHSIATFLYTDMMHIIHSSWRICVVSMCPFIHPILVLISEMIKRWYKDSRTEHRTTYLCDMQDDSSSDILMMHLVGYVYKTCIQDPYMRYYRCTYKTWITTHL